MKTVLCVWHKGGRGKSGTLREFSRLLLSEYNPKPSDIILSPPGGIPAKGDFRLVVRIKGKIVGVELKGDPDTDLKERLLDLADNFECDLILCTSRTRGDTVAAVDNLYENKEFKTIWTSTYQVEGTALQTIANRLKAKHILDLLKELKLI